MPGLAPAATVFHFRQRSTPLDWSKLHKLDIDAIVNQVDIAALQQVLDEVTFAAVSA